MFKSWHQKQAIVTQTFYDFSSFPPEKCKDISSNQAIAMSFHMLSNAIFSNHPIISSYRICETERVIEYIVSNILLQRYEQQKYMNICLKTFHIIILRKANNNRQYTYLEIFQKGTFFLVKQLLFTVTYRFYEPFPVISFNSCSLTKTSLRICHHQIMMQTTVIIKSILDFIYTMGTNNSYKRFQ